MSFSVFKILIVQAIISGTTVGCTYALIGLAIATVYNVARFFDISQGQYMMLGAMFVCFFYKLGLSITSSILFALFIPLVLGLLIWRLLLFGASQKYSHLTLLMITFGIALFIEGMAFLIFGTKIRVNPYYLNISPIRIYGATMSPQAPLIYGITFLIVLSLSLLFDRTTLGKGLRACHEQPLAARLMGIYPRNMMFFSFVLAVFLVVIGGIIVVPLTAVSYNMGVDWLIKGLLAAIVGGISRFHGVIIGALAIGLLESLAAVFISSGYASIIALCIFVALLLYRPTGLIGPKEFRV
jgi:branched-subunit amino acid ABC-type transport system permease component